jgi:hypothetical protein
LRIRQAELASEQVRAVGIGSELARHVWRVSPYPDPRNPSVGAGEWSRARPGNERP